MPLGQMIDMIDVHGMPFQVDAALRIKVGDSTGYIYGNAHTSRGRFLAWFPDEGDGFATSLDEIDSMSDEAACWIAGYLAGNEPDVWEYLGVDGFYDPSEVEEERWRRFAATFRQTGFCPPLHKRPVVPLPVSDGAQDIIDNANWRPWAYAGERVWVQPEMHWVEAEPQPKTDVWGYGYLMGSVCDQRGHHSEDLIELGAGWDLCPECGYVDVPAE